MLVCIRGSSSRGAPSAIAAAMAAAAAARTWLRLGLVLALGLGLGLGRRAHRVDLRAARHACVQ